MTIDELLLNVNNVNFSSLVCQTAVRTEADKAAYLTKGYNIELTEAQFREKFQVDPTCIWYTPSLSQGCIYFNEETLATAPFPVDFIIHGIYKDEKMLENAVQSREAEVADNQYMGSIISLPDAMRLEYFNRLVEKKGSNIPELYNLFFTNYVGSDYGFGSIASDTLSAILSAKTAEDKAKTEMQLQDYPDKLTIYRGGNSASTPYDKAYSWTLDINVANFFASRRGTGEGYIVQAEVEKKDVIEAFLEDGSEQEICVDPKDIQVVSKLPVLGIDFLKDTLPAVAPTFQRYRDQMMGLEFTQDLEEHGFEHEAKVLLNSLFIARSLGLPLRDWQVLATASIYHDTQRVNDIDDEVHGKAAAEYYNATVASPDPLVAFICEYHCRPDKEGYKEISENRKLRKNKSRAKLLYDIFKDADALDRVRFGIRALDLNQLRIPISKQLTLCARVMQNQIKVPGRPKLRKPSLSDRVDSAAQRVRPKKNKSTLEPKNR